MRSLPFLLGEAFISLRRHGWMTVAAVTTIAVVLTLLGSFAITLYQIDTMAHRAVSDFQMSVFCREDLPKTERHAVRLRIEAIPGVQRPVKFKTREQAFKEAMKDFPIDATDLPNRFNDTFFLKLTDPSRAPQIAQEIRGWHDVVQDVTLPEDEMGKMMHIAGVVRVIGFVAAAGLLLCALVVVSNTIRASMEARKGELKIMQIVGASPGFIRLPLMFEGLTHGLAGGVIAAGILVLAARSINQFIDQNVGMLTPYIDRELSMGKVSLCMIALGALIGAWGSLISMRRYLRP